MRHCYVLRVFTSPAGGGGNPLGVVPDSTGLSDTEMQRIAADLGFSETVFIDWPPGAIPALRIFTPAAEMPFAGHPLVGTAWVLNHLGPGVERMSIQIGEVGVHSGDDVTWVMPPPLNQPTREVPVEEAAGLGIEAIRAWRVEVPSEYLLAELETEADLVEAAPDLELVAAAADGLYLFQGRETVRSRFFGPRLGVDEDPATGSAAVAWCAVQRALGRNSGSGRIIQGVPGGLSEILIAWEGTAVRLGGSVVRDEVRVLEV